LGEFSPNGCLHWAAFCKITQVAPKSFGYFFHSKMYIFLTKMAWATFWAIFSPPHPVTLPPTKVVVIYLEVTTPRNKSLG
jgi:hypothetical protein